MRLSEMVLRRAHMLNCERRSQSLEEADNNNKLESQELNRVHTEPNLLSQCQFLFLMTHRLAFSSSLIFYALQHIQCI